MNLRGGSFPVSRADLDRYAVASGDANPIHLDPAAAAAAGLPDVIAHGMLLMGLAMRVVTGRAGGPGAVRDCSARFLRPVPVPEDGAVVDVEPTAQNAAGGDTAVTLLLRCDGRLVARITALVAPR
jgi:acyl dehydratase